MRVADENRSSTPQAGMLPLEPEHIDVPVRRFIDIKDGDRNVIEPLKFHDSIIRPQREVVEGSLEEFGRSRDATSDVRLGFAEAVSGC